MAKLLEYPFTKKSIASLRRGDEVSLTGVVYTARDQAHKRLVALIERGKTLPFDLRNHLL